MLFKRRSRDQILREHVADLKEAHEARVRELMRLVDMLAEQVEYLRSVVGTPFISAAHRGLNPTSQPPVSPDAPEWGENLLHVPEEEEDLMALREEGLVDDIQLAQIRESLGLPALARDDS